ncbi:hypothetical protein C1C98_05770 [Pseudomonas ogarae]|uniref:ClpX-type ZB domain-containing protein n=1 Tax=Pseudomonas ogarae (strain DSM 112162 / CECT 30235 / F113) TaxID=1114970 RepID=A0ABM6QUK2_PSEO1|nr:hypothetical protein C1C98_05770 [Pseudomonas ogarae]
MSAGTDPCGSELARDSGLTVDICVECLSVIASKLAPTKSPSTSRRYRPRSHRHGSGNTRPISAPS